MQNIGEEITGEYLRVIKNCDFIQYNLQTGEKQTEIDVVGINLQKKKVYICEVATHIQSLQYVKNARPDTENRFNKKFEKNIAYAERKFKEYKRIYMLWSPIVRKTKKENPKYCAQTAVENVVSHIKETHNIEIALVINEAYYGCLQELKEYAASRTEDLKNSAVLRFLQIEAYLEKHIKNLK